MYPQLERTVRKEQEPLWLAAWRHWLREQSGHLLRSLRSTKLDSGRAARLWRLNQIPVCPRALARPCDSWRLLPPPCSEPLCWLCAAVFTRRGTHLLSAFAPARVERAFQMLLKTCRGRNTQSSQNHTYIQCNITKDSVLYVSLGLFLVDFRFKFCFRNVLEMAKKKLRFWEMSKISLELLYNYLIAHKH